MSATSLSSRAIIGEFFARLEQDDGAGYVNRIATAPFKSDQAGEEYRWLGMSPAMREWVSGRLAKGFRDQGVTIKNLAFEATLEVTLDEIRRDKTQQVMIRVAEMADRANSHWAKLITALLLTGEAGLAYDGQFFFDTDHSEGASGTQSNDITADVVTPTAPTAAEFEVAVMKSVEQLYGLKDDQGEPLNDSAADFLVMVPVPFMGAAAAALKNPVIVDGSGARTNTIVNIGGFSFQLVVNPRLTWTTKFATFRADANTKPIIRQEEIPLEISAVAEGSELEFNERKHHYGIFAQRNVGFGYWQHAVLTTFI